MGLFPESKRRSQNSLKNTRKQDLIGQRNMRVGLQKNGHKLFGLTSQNSMFSTQMAKNIFWTDHPEILSENSITHTMKFGGGGVNVWSCITWQGVGFSCKIDETLDAELYSNILKEELMQTLEYYNLDINSTIFQQDNDPKHTSNLAKQTLKDLKLKVMEWPSQSPDLNPIEHFWNHVARELKRKGKLFSTKNQLWESLQKVLEEKNKELCRNLIGTMSRRVLDVIKAKGGQTKW